MKKKIIIAVIVLVVVVAAVLLLTLSKKKGAEQYQFTKVERGNLEAKVSSTGILNPVMTVQVGTQVSGIVSKLYTDFNKTVKKGDLIAQLDKSVLMISEIDAANGLERAKLQLFQNELDYKRTKTLFEQKLKTQSDMDTAEFNLKTAQSNLKSQENNLKKARINLDYADIYAPIDGTVVSRNIDQGQTVAANFSAPTLYLIANDLSKMQILANVDEGDIGQIKEGLDARFTVQAYPNRTFTGVVQQIRLQPTTVSNVVNYTVVINVANEDHVLMPGMTATIDFILGKATNVLKVANAALRIRPTPDMIALMRKNFEGHTRPDGARANGQGADNQAQSGERRNAQPAAGQGTDQRGGFAGMLMGQGNGQGNSRRPRDFAAIWYLDEKGNLKVMMVKTGLTDGQMTEIKSDKLTEGMTVIKSLLDTGNSPFGPQQGMPRMRF
jgi:HlyD family secretion protein